MSSVDSGASATADAGAARTRSTATVNGVRLSYLTQGSGPVVILLHGFPDLAESWSSQMDALASAGYRAIAPDLRGYGASERPAGIASYALDTLARDIVDLAEQLGAPVHLVGHDWGGVIAWHVAMHHPSMLHSLTIINAPHPKAFTRELARSWRQRLRSWYVVAFQLPIVPERALRALTPRLFAAITREGDHDAGTIARYVHAFSQPGAWTAAVNYYRALVRHRPARPVVITRPTLVLWGLQDPYLGPALIEGLERWVPDITVHPLADGGHWAQWSATKAVNEALVGFLGSPR